MKRHVRSAELLYASANMSNSTFGEYSLTPRTKPVVLNDKHTIMEDSCVLTHLICESAGAESPNIVLKLLGAALLLLLPVSSETKMGEKNKTKRKKPKSLKPE